MREAERAANAAAAAAVVFAAADKDSYDRVMLIVDAEESIRAMLKDPDSADFEHVDTYRTAKGAYVACGRVNAKNGFGGYNGYQRFVSPSTPSTTIVEGKVSDFAKAWAMCR